MGELSEAGGNIPLLPLIPFPLLPDFLHFLRVTYFQPLKNNILNVNRNKTIQNNQKVVAFNVLAIWAASDRVTPHFCSVPIYGCQCETCLAYIMEVSPLNYLRSVCKREYTFLGLSLISLPLSPPLPSVLIEVGESGTDAGLRPNKV